MVVPHHELVAGERIEGLHELVRLREGEVAGVRHSDVLSSQETLPGRLGEKRERLGEHERKRRREEPVQHPDHGRGRVLFDPERGPEAGAGRQAILDHLAPEEEPRGGEEVRDRRPGKRDALELAVHEQREELEERGVAPPAVEVHAEHLGLVPGE